MKATETDLTEAAQVEPCLLLPVQLAQNLVNFLAQLELAMDMGNARANFVNELSKLQPHVPVKPED